MEVTSMAGIDIEVLMPRREAVVRLTPYVVKKLGLDEDLGEHKCFVLLTTNEMDDGSCLPVFVCEFINGRVWNVPTDKVRFVDTVDGYFRE